MSEHGTAGGLLGYAALLWAGLPDTAVGRITAAPSGTAAGVPKDRGGAEGAIPAPRSAVGRRIEA